MKKLIVVALFLVIGLNVKGQSLSLLDSYPWSSNYFNASEPTITLDSLGYLHYSFTVYYPDAIERETVDFGGTYINIGLVLNPYSSIVNLLEFNNETYNNSTLPTGTVTHSGSFYIGNYFSDLRMVFISVGTGVSYFDNPYVFKGYGTYDEYEFIP